MSKKILCFILALTMLLSCISAVADSGSVIRIGVVAPLTGGSAIYGEGAGNAVAMAVEEINALGGAFTVEIVGIADDGAQAQQAMNAYNSLLPNEPDAIIGSFFSSVTLPMAAAADESGISGAADTASIVAGMTGMTFTGVGGTFTLDENGDPEKACVVNTYADGAVKWCLTLAPDGSIASSAE